MAARLPDLAPTAPTAPTDAAGPCCGGLSRRRALGGAAALGFAGPLLAACGSDAEEGTAADPATSGPASPTAEGPLASTSDVPVGGGLILEDQGVVITQPTEGDFVAFSNICTHQGCPVTSVEAGTINCTCHGSSFSIADGEPQSGPAEAPLPPIEVSVQGDEISLA